MYLWVEQYCTMYIFEVSPPSTPTPINLHRQTVRVQHIYIIHREKKDLEIGRKVSCIKLKVLNVNSAPSKSSFTMGKAATNNVMRQGQNSLGAISKGARTIHHGFSNWKIKDHSAFGNWFRIFSWRLFQSFYDVKRHSWSCLLHWQLGPNYQLMFEEVL